MILTNFIRGIVKKRPELKLKLKKAFSKITPFQYVSQMLFMTIFSVIALLAILFPIFRENILIYLGIVLIIVLMTPAIFAFWMSYVDVQVNKMGRELDQDLMFVSEYFLVSLESGLPLGNAIKNLSEIKRPGGRFFKRVYTEFRTGKDLEGALEDAIAYSASEELKNLLKRLKDSLSIGVDLRKVLENFIKESSEKKIIEIKGYSKKLNPIVMMYLILGIVMPSLGVTFFILAAAIIDITPDFLRLILVLIFLIMFAIQYVAYSAFKFSKATI